MNKNLLIAGLLAVASLARADSCQLFSNLSCNNNYTCSLPLANVASGQQVTSCTFTFSSVCAPLASLFPSLSSLFPSSGLLYCNLLGNNSICNIGSQSCSATTWSCTLDSNGLTYLNNCLSSGTSCSFGLNCLGNWNIGTCNVTYSCGGTPKNNVPDTSMTVCLLGLTLLGMELSRRKLALVSVK